MIIRIATRKSPLAMVQARFIGEQLVKHHPQLNYELVSMTTKGDQILDRNLAAAGGKGLFIKELEHAMLADKADIAVHSLKDMPVELPPGLMMPVFCHRSDVRDAFVSGEFTQLQALPQGARVGTSSLRRRAQLLAWRSDLTIIDCRGNINTRLQKLDNGEYDALILASAGLLRMGFTDRIRHPIDLDIALPAVGQGVLGIECRQDDEVILDLIKVLDEADTHQCVIAERQVNAALNGGCHVPIGAYACFDGPQIYLRALVGAPDGSRILRSQARGDKAQAVAQVVVDDLLKQGAKVIIDEVYRQHG